MISAKNLYSLIKKSAYYIIFLAATANFAKAQEIRLLNPIKSERFEDLIALIASYISKIGIPIAAVFIILSGFMFLAARGNEEKLKTAKTMLLWSIIGTVIIVGAWVFAQAAVNFARSL